MHEPDAVAPRRAPIETARYDDVCLVVPLFNEGAVIGQVVKDATVTFPHVVCVDDGSTDDSAERAHAAGAIVLRHAVNLGQGAALQTGIEYARTLPGTRYLVTFDADGQHQVDDAAAMVDLAREEDVAIVFGSRFLDSRTRPGLVKRVVLRTAVWFTNMSTGLRLTDAHNGLRVVRVDAARGINLQQDRMAHASEIVLQLGRTRLPWREYPVHLLYTDYSRSKGQSLWNSVNILVDLVFK
ncbi:glycosyltransferase family 2 protein [Cellulosimicrobium protaetiae]|uniref:Glycosyltransferase family 2 protein n=1 Tax=Cellulosimicrobium protaetiae TaxID=2587808 RepID=A0A6M5UFP0_9MICO|nr:glycosyltransferase family 2 protein [Cellulosimicrobium protaetiae]QJW36085.1 glycosyltransferase family 2 protein [Cellulosimicrobium protaetiae]